MPVSALARLKCGCAGALVLLWSGAAWAQAVPANGSVIAGGATISHGRDVTNVVVSGRETVINWTLDQEIYARPSFSTPTVTGLPSGAVNFLQPGSVLNITSTGAADGGYVLLNRLLMPGTPVINGTVQSFAGQNHGNSSVWFYSPNGMIVGPRGWFFTGNLVLTTSDIDRSGGLLAGGNTIRFRGQSGSTAAIDIRAGSRMTTFADDAYLAIVAPRIVQGGLIQPRGSAALVAAEVADIRIDAGLLDIVVTQGTTDANGIVHTGRTTGRSNGNPATISLVAIPKNEALTMLLSGTVGYSAVSAARNDGYAVVLSAGTPGGPSANIATSDTAFRSRVTADASGTIALAGSIDLPGGGAFAAGGDIRLGGAVSADAGLGFATPGATIVSGRLSGPAITASSGDIAIGAEGQILGRDIALTSTRATAIGGAGQASAYNLDSAELARIFAGTVTVSAPGDLAVGDLTLGGNLSALRLRASGTAAVAGAVRWTTAATSDSLAIEAGRIDITGSIVLRSGTGALQSRLLLTADSIIAADSATNAAVSAGVLPDAVKALLDRPRDTPGDFIAAGEIVARVSERFLVQNGGTTAEFADRRGFSANRLSVTSVGNGALLALNGAITDEQGQPVTGLATAARITREGPFVAGSAINGCAIGADCTPRPVDPDPPVDPVDPEPPEFVRPPMPPLWDIIGPIDYRRNLDLPHSIIRDEKLDRSNGDISLLDRNDTIEFTDRDDAVRDAERTGLDEILRRTAIEERRESAPIGEGPAVVALVPGKSEAVPIMPRDSQLLANLLFFAQPDPARQTPLLDQPVTGVGNDDFWQPVCSPDQATCEK